MGQHPKIQWTRPEAGQLASKCGRWRCMKLDKITRPAPSTRWVLLDLDADEAEVFEARTLRECKVAAQECEDGVARHVDPRAAVLGVDAPVILCALGGAVAWRPGMLPVAVTTHPQRRRRVDAIRQDEARAARLEIERVEAELALTDGPAPSLEPRPELVGRPRFTRRPPMPDVSILATADGVAMLLPFRVPATPGRPLLPRGWVDVELSLRDPIAGSVSIAHRVYIRATDTRDDVRRRVAHCIHAAVMEARDEHPDPPTQPPAQGGGAAPGEAARDHGDGHRPVAHRRAARERRADPEAGHGPALDAAERRPASTPPARRLGAPHHRERPPGAAPPRRGQGVASLLLLSEDLRAGRVSW